MRTVFINIRELLQVRPQGQKSVAGDAMKTLPKINNAFLIVQNDCISGFGSMTDFRAQNGDEIIDATDRLILPCWCDSHSHVVYA